MRWWGELCHALLRSSCPNESPGGPRENDAGALSVTKDGCEAGFMRTLDLRRR